MKLLTADRLNPRNQNVACYAELRPCYRWRGRDGTAVHRIADAGEAPRFALSFCPDC